MHGCPTTRSMPQKRNSCNVTPSTFSRMLDNSTMLYWPARTMMETNKHHKIIIGGTCNARACIVLSDFRVPCAPAIPWRTIDRSIPWFPSPLCRGTTDLVATRYCVALRRVDIPVSIVVVWTLDGLDCVQDAFLLSFSFSHAFVVLVIFIANISRTCQSHSSCRVVMCRDVT